jgi:hypothetical protein
MKLSLLLCALVLSVPGWCASGTPAASRTVVVPAHSPVIGKEPLVKKPLRERKLYYKGKGTLGFIFGITLGPLGYGAVHLFSHNQTARDKAKEGMIGWLFIAMTTVVVWGAIVTKVSLDDFLLGFLQGLAQAY